MENEYTKLFRYSVICAFENLPKTYPVTLRGDIHDVAKRAATAGADAIELHLRDPFQYDSKELVKTANNNGLVFSVVSTGLEYGRNGLSLISDDIEIRKSAIKRLKEHIDFAEGIGSPAIIIGVIRGNIPDFEKYNEYEGRLTEAVFVLSDYAAGRPVEVFIESINRYVNNYLCSVPETLRYLEKLDRQNVRIHIDTHQMNIEDVDFYKTIKMCGDKLGYIHLSDSNRTCPGGGNIDFLPVMKALREIDYKGFAGIESVECPAGDDALKTSFEMLRGLENEV